MHLSGGSQCAIIVPLPSTIIIVILLIGLFLTAILYHVVKAPLRFFRAFSSDYCCKATRKGTVSSNIFNEKNVFLWLSVSAVAQTIGKHDGPETQKRVCVKPPFAFVSVSDSNHRLCQVSSCPLYNFALTLRWAITLSPDALLSCTHHYSTTLTLLKALTGCQYFPSSNVSLSSRVPIALTASPHYSFLALPAYQF
jgi:hypothetical protein